MKRRKSAIVVAGLKTKTQNSAAEIKGIKETRNKPMETTVLNRCYGTNEF